MMGYNILNAILAGQTLSVVSGGKLSWDVGIVIIRCVLGWLMYAQSLIGL